MIEAVAMEIMSFLESLSVTWARPEHMAILFYIAAIIGAYVFKVRNYKRLPKLWKVTTLFFIAFVYTLDAFTHPEAIAIRPLFRVALLLLVFGEIAYNGDHLLSMAESIRDKLYGRERER